MESERRRFLSGWTSHAILFLAFLLAVVVHRAATQSITCDEALTDQWFVSTPWRELTRWFDANNHVLFTLLSKVSTQVLGTSEITLRLPSVLAALAYFAAVFVLSREVCGDGLAFVAAVAALSLNPFVLDYLCAARGYGLALACLMWGLALMAWALGGRHRRAGRARVLAAASIALGLSVTASLAFAFVIIGLGLAALGLLLADGRRGHIPRGELPTAVLALTLPGPSVATLILVPFLVHAPRNTFYAGHDSWREAARDVAAAWLFHDRSEGLGAMEAFAFRGALVGGAFVAAILASALTASSLMRAVRGPRPGPDRPGNGEALLVLVVGSLVVALALHAAGHRFLGLLYPHARGALWVIPLTTLALVLGVSRAPAGGLTGAARWIGAALISGLVFAYLYQFQTSVFRDYSYDAGSRAIFERIRAARAGSKPASLVVAAWPFQCPSFEFYQRTRAAGWTVSCRGTAWPDDGGWDVRLLRPEDLAMGWPRGADEMFRDAASGTIVLARGAQREGGDPTR